MVWDRYAARQFATDDVPDEDVQTILTLATQAPSGFNLQPWRFVVVRDQEQRDRLCRAAHEQAIVAEAPVVVVAYGLRRAWRETAGTILREAAARGCFDTATVNTKYTAAVDFVAAQDISVWLNRHVMIAFTYMMVAAQALGWDTAPMEAFDAAAVQDVLALPADAEVVALLGIGRLANPDAIEPGRLPLAQLVCAEVHGIPWRDPAETLREPVRP